LYAYKGGLTDQRQAGSVRLHSSWSLIPKFLYKNFFAGSPCRFPDKKGVAVLCTAGVPEEEDLEEDDPPTSSNEAQRIMIEILDLNRKIQQERDRMMDEGS
jgi:hypothetical protein